MYQERIGLQVNNYLNNTYAFFECKLTFDNLLIQANVIHKHALFIEFNVTGRKTHVQTQQFPFNPQYIRINDNLK